MIQINKKTDSDDGFNMTEVREEITETSLGPILWEDFLKKEKNITHQWGGD